MLLSHRGTSRLVMSDVGGPSDVNNKNIILDDQAASPLPDQTVITGGSYKPRNFDNADLFLNPAPFTTSEARLAGFDGKNPNGDWELWVMDDSETNVGHFDGGWSVKIKARVVRR